MSDQVQCPNCGGYKIKTVEVKNIFAERAISLDERKQRAIAFLKMLPASIVLAVISFFSIKTFDSIMSAYFCSSSIIVVALFLILASMYTKTERVRTGQIYNYYCYLCGYKWSWETGTPLPKVDVRPDLILAGEQRLKEEREQDAAAHEAAENALRRGGLR